MSDKSGTPSATVSQVSIPYKNPALPINQRVSDLLKRMTLKEKVAQMLGIWRIKNEHLIDADGQLCLGYLEENFVNGLGQISRLSDLGAGLAARDMANTANRIQKFFVENTRLGIPVIVHEECLHGLMAPEATSFPQPIAMASSFDSNLVYEIYSAIAADTRSRGAHQALTPVVDVARDPRWGTGRGNFW